MTRTTELLKEIEECDMFIEKDINLINENAKGRYNACKHADLIEEIRGLKCGKEERKSELRGRLDALKEEYSFWKKSGFTEMLLGFPLIKERIASIQEEIKLIETAGVGK